MTGSMASNPLLKFKEEILNTVIYSKVYKILEYSGNNITPNTLWKQFREKYECSVSFKEFNEWLEIMGLNQEQVTTWNIDMPVQVHDGLAEEPQNHLQQFNDTKFVPTKEDLDALFDNE